MAIACLGCGNLFDSRLCKDDNFARFLVRDWKAAKYAISVNMSHYIESSSFQLPVALSAAFFYYILGVFV